MRPVPPSNLLLSHLPWLLPVVIWGLLPPPMYPTVEDNLYLSAIIEITPRANVLLALVYTRTFGLTHTDSTWDEYSQAGHHG